MKKRVACWLSVLLLCLSMGMPAFAAGEDFVESITYKGHPEIVSVKDAEGNEWLGTITNASGEILAYIGEECLVVTSIAKALEYEKNDVEHENALDPAVALLIDVYEALMADEMELPYGKVSSEIDPDKQVIRDLFDATWLCEDHPEIVEPEGVVLTLTFDLGVDADTEVIAMAYKNEAWNPIEKVVNNGDGTVTCTFEHLCPIAFSVPVGLESPTTGDSVGPNLMLWGGLLVVSAAGLVALAVYSRKRG